MVVILQKKWGETYLNKVSSDAPSAVLGVGGSVWTGSVKVFVGSNNYAPSPGSIGFSKGFILAIDRRINGAETPTFIATSGFRTSVG